MVNREKISGYVCGLISLVALVLFLWPFLWMFAGSFKPNPEIFDTKTFLPRSFSFRYYSELVSGEYFDFWRSLKNTLFSSLLQSVGATLFASGAAFVFATSDFRFRKTLFFFGLLSIFIPTQVLALTLFVWVNSIGLFDTIWGVAIPAMSSGIGLIYFVKVFRGLPQDFIDSARLEGGNELQVFGISLNLVRPHLVTFAFVTFALSWHSNLLSMLVLHSESQRTLVLSLSSLYGSGLGAPVAVLMAGSCVSLALIFGTFVVAFPHLRNAMKEFMG